MGQRRAVRPALPLLLRAANGAGCAGMAGGHARRHPRSCGGPLLERRAQAKTGEATENDPAGKEHHGKDGETTHGFRINPPPGLDAGVSTSRAQSFRPRRRRELLITETELALIAAAASMGLNSTPRKGYSTPAATGTPSAL